MPTSPGNARAPDPKEYPVSTALDMLGAVAADLGAKMATLKGRLGVVMLPEDPPGPTGTAAEEPSRCDLDSRIHGNTERIREIEAEVDTILGLLQV